MKIEKIINIILTMSLQIPNEIMNIILSYREKHPIRSIICCSNCGDEEYFNDYLYIYNRKYIRKHFELVCSDCKYDLCKH